MPSNQMASPSLFPLPVSSLHPGCTDHTLFFCRSTAWKRSPHSGLRTLHSQSAVLSSFPSYSKSFLDRSLFFIVTVPSLCHSPSLCLYFFLLSLIISLFPICFRLWLRGRRSCLARSAAKTLALKFFFSSLTRQTTEWSYHNNGWLSYRCYGNNLKIEADIGVQEITYLEVCFPIPCSSLRQDDITL